MLGALEHHVLEQVREAGAILRLDAKADRVVDPDHRRRRRGVAGEHHFQAVLQLVVLIGTVTFEGNAAGLAVAA